MDLPTTYKNIFTGSYATETQLRDGGVNVESKDVMDALGWKKIFYPYPEYNRWTEGMLADGEPVLNADQTGYVQNFKVVPLDDDAIAANLEIYKGEAMDRLNAAWLAAEQHGKIESSAGFAIDATERANRDISGLITMLEQTGQTEASFCGADNAMRPVTLEQLKTMRLEVIEHGQSLYAKKWAMRAAIEGAASFEAVDAVKISFAEVQ